MSLVRYLLSLILIVFLSSLIFVERCYAEIKTNLDAIYEKNVPLGSKQTIKTNYLDDLGKSIENAVVRINNSDLVGLFYEKDKYCEETIFQSKLNSVTQVFIPTKDNIAKISVNLRKGRDANFTIFIQLGDCRGDILGTSSKLYSSQMLIRRSTFDWYDFTFFPIVKVTPDEKYIIKVICEGDCGRSSEVEDQIAFSYTNNDNCDKTGYIGECEETGRQDLSYKTYYEYEISGTADMIWNSTSKTYDYEYLASKFGINYFLIKASDENYQEQIEKFDIQVNFPFNSYWLPIIPIAIIILIILWRRH
jgi:hypothetical protein